jgi:hypothetical protein
MRFLPHVSTFALLACASPAFAQVQPCPLTKIGSPCGAELDVASLQGSQPGTLDLSLRVHSAPVNSAALLFVGGARLNLPLPARNCPLLTRPDLILALVTDAQGEARIALPGPLDPGLRLFVQSAVIAAPARARLCDLVGCRSHAAAHGRARDLGGAELPRPAALDDTER